MSRPTVILTTKWWRSTLFTDVMALPDHLAKSFRFFEVDDTNAASLAKSAERFLDEVRGCTEETFPCVVTVTDTAMFVFAWAAQSLPFRPLGSSWEAFAVCSHKLLTRRLVPRCGGIPFTAVSASDEVVPVLGKHRELILKPVLGVSSIGVHRVAPGDPNPYFGMKTSCDMLHIDERFLPEKLRSAFDEEAVGILEAYVPPDAARKVSVDAFVFEGRKFPWAITDNVYQDDDPEQFDHLLCPTAALTPAEQSACWKAFDEICTGLHRDFGLDHQFVCVEFFVFNEHQVEVMEINPRISANPIPLFDLIFEDGDPVQAMIELQLGNCPPTPRARRSPRVGAALYRKTAEGAGEISRSESLVYYDRLDKAHVYNTGTDPATVVAEAERFYAELRA